MPSDAIRMWRPMLRAPRRVDAMRWVGLRTATARWYPQGIAVGTWRGRRTLAVSWFRQRTTGEHLASRLTMVDLAHGRFVDLALVVDGDDSPQPARIHAGGLAWLGDRMLVAATREGVWEFDLSRVARVRGADAARVRASRRRVPGRAAWTVARTRVHALPMRCSFLGTTLDAAGAPQRRVVVGEYRQDARGRLRAYDVPLDADADLVPLDEAMPGLATMQGVVRMGDRELVSQSRGMRPGALWLREGDEQRRIGSLPIGCEDLALDPEARTLWTLGEHPWRRVVRAIDWDAIGLQGDVAAQR